MANPVFANSKQFQHQDAPQPVGFDVPPAPGLEAPDRMTYDGVLVKASAFFLLAVAAAVVNIVLIMIGGPDIREMDIPGTSIPLGLILSLFAIALGAFMLISDFDFVDNGVRNGIPAKWEWAAAYGLVFSIIWIYIEMLRLLSYLRR